MAPPQAAWESGRAPCLPETGAPGIFACGDVRNSPVKRVAAPIGKSSMAIAFVQYLKAVDARVAAR
jgi:thioredoxin reductase (NADPH)